MSNAICHIVFDKNVAWRSKPQNLSSFKKQGSAYCVGGQERGSKRSTDSCSDRVHSRPVLGTV